VPFPELPENVTVEDWLVSQTDDDWVPVFASFTLEQLRSYGNKVTLGFGKHKGKTFVSVAENDPSYCKFFASVKNSLNSKYFSLWHAAWVALVSDTSAKLGAETVGSVDVEAAKRKLDMASDARINLERHLGSNIQSGQELSQFAKDTLKLFTDAELEARKNYKAALEQQSNKPQ
jgi:hypothetical protein